jgi:hypothetical protein
MRALPVSSGTTVAAAREAKPLRHLSVTQRIHAIYFVMLLVRMLFTASKV